NVPAPQPPSGQLLIYSDGTVNLQVRLDGQTVWLAQGQMAELYQSSKQNISLHIQNILEDKELRSEAVVKEYLTTAADGKRYRTLHYSLDMILAIGYRVRSPRGTAFRQWATARLSELLIKGFTLDDERIKAGRTIGADYFDELLARIRDIRASERLFYQKITDIYATSIDYEAKAELTQLFFQTVQNKMHWAAHGHTAAEIVVERADAGKPNMGLTTWKNAPSGLVRKGDVATAKNYLAREELESLNLIVSAYLDFAELQARSHRPMHMADWIAKLDDFIRLSERDILPHAGRITHQQAEEHAHDQYELYERQRREVARADSSDFDIAARRLTEQTSAPKPRSRKKKTDERPERDE
ncbi:MAG: virulence RhuM family protein, partial [Candidatus Saccharimonadales bacterium]